MKTAPEILIIVKGNIIIATNSVYGVSPEIYNIIHKDNHAQGPMLAFTILTIKFV